MLRRFIEDVIFADPTIDACVCDPEADNLRSLRAFERAGFAQIGRVRRPDEAEERVVVGRTRS